MGIVDMFTSEDRVNLKFSDFYELIKNFGKPLHEELEEMED